MILPRRRMNTRAICPRLFCVPVFCQYLKGGGSIHEPQVKFSELALKVEECIVNPIVKRVRASYFR